MAAPAKRTGPYTPPTAPTVVPKEDFQVNQDGKATLVPATTDPIRVPETTVPAEPSTDTGLIATDALVAGTQQMRLTAENRRAVLAERITGLQQDWQEHQSALTELRKRHSAIVAEMNAIAADLDPLVSEHERLRAAVSHYDVTLETLGGAR